jgi:hypothetical protein
MILELKRIAIQEPQDLRFLLSINTSTSTQPNPTNQTKPNKKYKHSFIKHLPPQPNQSHHNPHHSKMSTKAPAAKGRDYSRSDYAPSDPNQVVYNWKTGTFSYKPRSQITATYSEPVPKFKSDMYLTPPWEKFNKRVVLPGRVRAGRLLENYKTLYIDEK